ncbi:MAG TPA: winged helix-turn-helix domain-containing protein [Allosphingosinicella sp.]
MLNTARMAALDDRRIGALSVSPGRRRIDGPAGSVPLEPLVLHLLLLLADADGRVVARSVLFDELWGSPEIGDDSLNRLVAALRRALERAGGGVSIETVPRTGYRLVADLEAPLSDAPEHRGSGLTRRNWLAAGSGVAALAAFGGLAVALRKRADEREAAELVNRARRIVSDGIPWELPQAQKLLEQAVQADPANGAALGLLSSMHALGIESLPPAERPRAIQQTDQLIRRALMQAPANADAQLARLALDQGTLTWAQYEDRLLGVRRAAPRSTEVLTELTYFSQSAGHTRRSGAYNEQVIGLDPISPQPRWRKALKCWIMGRTADADRIVDAVRTMWPEHPGAWNARLLIYAFTGRAHAALRMIDNPVGRPRSVTPASMAQWRPTLAALEEPGGSRLSDAVAANLAGARKSPGQAAYAAMALSALGQMDAAYEVAEGFLVARGPLLTNQPIEANRLLVNNPGWRRTQWLFTPPMKAFRADRRFSGLCDALSLTDYWSLRGPPDIL